HAGAIWNWEHQIEALGQHVTLFIPDVLGQGLSDKPRLAYTPDLYVEWLRGFLKALGLERAALIRHSMGAGLALGLALTHPDRVDRLVLISGFPDGVLTHVRGPSLRFFARAGPSLPPPRPGSRLVVNPDARHLPMLERPDKVNRLITEFLSSTISS